jgi:protein-tyrosine phosphatase
MAEALLRRALAGRGVAAVVTSAGSYPGGVAASPGSVDAMARRGLDLRGHRSRTLDAGALAAADLVVCMARRHCREVVAGHPRAWPRTFTLRELVRRGERRGPRRPGEPLAAWLDALGEGRTRAGLLADHPDDDVADPIGGPASGYEATARVLEDLVARAVDLAFPEGCAGAAS